MTSGFKGVFDTNNNKERIPMRKFTVSLISILAMIGGALMSCAPEMAHASESIVQNSIGVYVKSASTGIYSPVSLQYCTDGAGNFVPCKHESGGVGVVPLRLNASSTNIPAASYVALTTNLSQAVSQVNVWNGSGQEVILATGTTDAASNVIDVPASQWSGPTHLYLAQGSALSLIAATTTATSGVVVVNLLQ